MRQRIVIIVGMHRSGTSALAGSLEEAGLYLGRVVKTSIDNPKGWCENPVVFTMHEQLLRLNGGTTYSPPDVCRWTSIHELMRDTVIDAFGERAIWGFKDPRTLFTLDGWLKAIPHAEIVGIVRNPRLVCDSLLRRDNLSEMVAMNAWLKYNSKLLQWHRRLSFPIVSFDDLDLTFEEQLRGLAVLLQMPSQLRELEYYENRFRRTDLSRVKPLSSEVQEVHEALKEACIATISSIVRRGEGAFR